MFLTEDSFSSILKNPKGHWIIISAKFENVGDSVEETYLNPLDDKIVVVEEEAEIVKKI